MPTGRRGSPQPSSCWCRSNDGPFLWNASAALPPAAVNWQAGSMDTTSRFAASAPLGGVAPVEQTEPAVSDRRDLVVAAALLIAAVVSALASLMSWRDYGKGLDPRENGWMLADGSFGRGWVAIAVAVVLAVAGVLLVAGRRRSARRWARVGSIALIVGPVLEWAIADGDSRTGPGAGLWLLLGVGLVVMVLLGTVLPHDDPAPTSPVAPIGRP